MTLNEPWCSAWLGYGSGRHAPGITDHAQAARATHHLLLGHGRAVRAMREQAPADHQLGIVLNLSGFVPAPSLAPEDAARVEAAVAPLDGMQNRLWLDAVLEGRYPQDVLHLLSPALPGASRTVTSPRSRHRWTSSASTTTTTSSSRRLTDRTSSRPGPGRTRAARVSSAARRATT